MRDLRGRLFWLNSSTLFYLITVYAWLLIDYLPLNSDYFINLCISKSFSRFFWENLKIFLNLLFFQIFQIIVLKAFSGKIQNSYFFINIFQIWTYCFKGFFKVNSKIISKFIFFNQHISNLKLLFERLFSG